MISILIMDVSGCVLRMSVLVYTSDHARTKVVLNKSDYVKTMQTE